MCERLLKLKKSYDDSVQDANAFREALRIEISHLLHENSVKPAVPIEHRTKEWASILVKYDRLLEPWEDVGQIWDMVGLRTVFLFPEEATKACELFHRNFDVLERIDVGKDFSVNEFGYKSIHFTVRFPSQWLKAPSLRKHSNFQAEIQVRTLSQHNWAVASRVLQYNKQSSVPPPVQRSLFRVAALLELVDLELERVNKQREDYRALDFEDAKSQKLNVDLLVALLNTYLPESHYSVNDDYVGLFSDLDRRGISEPREIKDLINKYLPMALENDRIALEAVRSGNTAYHADPSRIDRGVFYSHAGLVQNMLNQKFGVDWRKLPE